MHDFKGTHADYPYTLLLIVVFFRFIIQKSFSICTCMHTPVVNVHLPQFFAKCGDKPIIYAHLVSMLLVKS